MGVVRTIDSIVIGFPPRPIEASAAQSIASTELRNANSTPSAIRVWSYPGNPECLILLHIRLLRWHEEFEDLLFFWNALQSKGTETACHLRRE